MIQTTYADLLRPSVRSRSLIYDMALVLGGSLVVALSAQISFRIGPVPLTAQTLAVVLVGALLGSRRGALALAAYLLEGAAGMPVFANGMAGIAYMAGPTGGYMAGFVGAAWLTGFLAERGWDRRTVTTLAMMIAGHAVIFVPGLIWLAVLTNSQAAVSAGLVPFLPGCVVKICLATFLLPSGWKILQRFR